MKRKLIPAVVLLAAMLSMSLAPVDAQQPPTPPPTPPVPVVVEPTVTIKVEPASVQVRDLISVVIESNGTATEVEFPVGLGTKFELKAANAYMFQPKKAGTFTINAVTVKDGKLSKITSATVEVLEPPPTPTPPVPPQPPVPPTPPTPPPTPDTAPIKEPGLRVLIVYESADVAKYPSAQIAAIYSQEFWNLLNSNTAIGPDGKTREWRFWDQNVDVSKESALWQSAMKRPRTSLPWIVISNGKTGFEGPLPATLNETMELVRKHIPVSHSMTDTQRQYIDALEKLK